MKPVEDVAFEVEPDPGIEALALGRDVGHVEGVEVGEILRISAGEGESKHSLPSAGTSA